MALDSVRNNLLLPPFGLRRRQQILTRRVSFHAGRWIEEAYSGEELDIEYACVSCPYYSYNYWGGLEYNNDDALLDGSVGHSNWWFAVGAISTIDYNGIAGIPGPYDYTRVDDAGYYGAPTQVLPWSPRQNEYYLQLLGDETTKTCH